MNSEPFVTVQALYRWSPTHRPNQQQLTAARQQQHRSPTRQPAPDAFGQLPVHQTPPTAYGISARLSATCMAQNMTAFILV